MSKTKLRTPQTPPSFSTTRVGLKRVESKKSRLSGDSFERARLPRLHCNCTQFGTLTHRDTHVFHTLTHVHSFRLCIPTDTDRPFNILKSGFLSKPTASGMSHYSHHSILSVTNLGTGLCVPSVPVIGIFTKTDGRLDIVMGSVLGPDSGPEDFVHPPREVEQRIIEFMNKLETRFRNEPYPPVAFIRVGGTYILYA
jgi:hypothetical protein